MTIKLYDGARVTILNGEKGVCKLGGKPTSTYTHYPYEIHLDNGKRIYGYSLSGRFGVGINNPYDVVSVEEPEFKDGDKVEVWSPYSEVWAPYTYALKFKGGHFVYSILEGRDTLIKAPKVRKPEPRYKYRWLMQNPETGDVVLSDYYETEEEAEAGMILFKVLYPIEESKKPV